MPRPRLSVAAAVVAAFLLALAGVASRPGHAQDAPGSPDASGRPADRGAATAPPPDGPSGAARGVTAFSAQGDRWVWLRQEGEESLLFSGGPGVSPQEWGRGKEWRDVSLEGDVAYVLTREGLLRVGADKKPTRLHQSRLPHAGLLVKDGVAYWGEIAPASGAPYLPEGGPTLQIYRRPLAASAGEAKLLGSWPAPDESGEGGAVRFLGLEQGVLTLQLRRLLSTEWVEVDTGSGQVQGVAAASGNQTGTLQKGRLYWTAPSAEAAVNAMMIRVCTRTNSSGTVEAATVSEWLPIGGTLVATEDALYYAGASLYRLRRPEEMAVELQRLAQPSAAFDGRRLVLLNEGPAPQALEARP